MGKIPSTVSVLWYTGAAMKASFSFSRIWVLPVAFLLGLGGAILLYFATAQMKVVIIDGERITIRTHARTVATALQGAGIQIVEGDKVFPDPETALNEVEIIEFMRGSPVDVVVDGEVNTYVTAEKTAADILRGLGISLMPGDQIWVDGLPVEDPGSVLPAAPISVEILKAHSIQLAINGEEVLLRTTAPTLGQALEEAGIWLFEGDELVPSADTPTKGLITAQLNRGQPINVHVDGVSVEALVVAKSVHDALRAAGIALVGLDYTMPDGDIEIPSDGEIRVVRVSEEIVLEQTPIPFETVYEPDPESEIDHQSILDSGSYGVQANRVRIRFDDGEEVGRSLEGEWVTREPEPRRIGYGTNIVVRTLNTPDGPIEYWRAITMYATSYSPSRAGVPEDYVDFGITACGKRLVKGLVAIDRRYIPFHTMMYVPGYGFAEACDTGGGVKGRWIDLGYEDDNYEPWHQNVTVYFLTPVPPANSIAWIFP
ncbi:MAG: DUF348 domain-containing protein [Anaerolineales bacterium]|nr:DUF348 domain-containing protein [Anaerolineales bacterium]